MNTVMKATLPLSSTASWVSTRSEAGGEDWIETAFRTLQAGATGSGDPASRVQDVEAVVDRRSRREKARRRYDAAGNLIPR